MTTVLPQKTGSEYTSVTKILVCRATPRHGIPRRRSPGLTEGAARLSRATIQGVWRTNEWDSLLRYHFFKKVKLSFSPEQSFYSENPHKSLDSLSSPGTSATQQTTRRLCSPLRRPCDAKEGHPGHRRRVHLTRNRVTLPLARALPSRDSRNPNPAPSVKSKLSRDGAHKERHAAWCRNHQSA
jgi:hypothetical protein